jgi:heme-degrading monooxygenase HmoA
MSFADLPEPPYYAVIFSSQRTEGDNGYGDMADRMVALASEQPGFLGIDVSYFRTLEDIAAWKANAEHREAQRLGHQRWYGHFELRIAKVERAYGKGRPRG